MTKLTQSLLLSSLLALPMMSVFAADAGAAAVTAKPLSSSQLKMKDCNASATGKTGVERKAFMSSCLSGDAAAAGTAKTTQQQKMTSCNAEATTKALKGPDRRSFMSTCLKG